MSAPVKTLLEGQLVSFSHETTQREVFIPGLCGIEIKRGVGPQKSAWNC
jgi:hypothetical protein